MSLVATIYHNPACSKSREAIDYLLACGLELDVIEYLETPPSVETLRELVKMLGVAASSLIRARDFQRLGLSPASDTDGWLRLIVEYPQILERPIVVVGRRARIGRPVENLDDLVAEAQAESDVPPASLRLPADDKARLRKNG